MESFVLKWPEREKWKIVRSSVEGDGRTIAFQLKPEQPSLEGEEALQLICLPKEKPLFGDFFEKWLEDFSQKHPGLDFQKLPHTLSCPSRIFLLQNLIRGGQRKSAIGFMAMGEQGILLHLNLLPQGHFPHAAIGERIVFFETLQIKNQRLEDSLVESSLMPPRALTNQRKQLTRHSNLMPPYLREFAHPLHPEDFSYWKIFPDDARKELFWARILKVVERELFVAMDLFDEDSRSFYLQWDAARQSFIRISTEGLSLRDKVEIKACDGCGFRALDPVFIQKNEASPSHITCPFCQGKIKIRLKL